MANDLSYNKDESVDRSNSDVLEQQLPVQKLAPPFAWRPGDPYQENSRKNEEHKCKDKRNKLGNKARDSHTFPERKRLFQEVPESGYSGGIG